MKDGVDVYSLACSPGSVAHVEGQSWYGLLIGKYISGSYDMEYIFLRNKRRNADKAAVRFCGWARTRRHGSEGGISNEVAKIA
jgi:hypothetical protein